MNKKLSDNISSSIISSRQRALDRKMVPYDIWGTCAHVIMLSETDILSESNAAAILSALSEIEEEVEQKTYEIDEDKGAHLTLEDRIKEIAGEEAGLSAHTARSRNDQVMVTELLYLRERTLNLLEQVRDLIRDLRSLAEDHKTTVMPGYTHMQPAKPTSVASWCLSYADGFARGAAQLQHQYERYNRCPLGAVESYGTSWAIDRERTAELLGFDGVWPMPQDAISSRGQFQLSLLSGANELLLPAGKLASDLMLFSTREFNYMDFGENVAQRLHPITGSSVMAQKKNPDAVELVRGAASQMPGLVEAVSGLLHKLPMGYNRDSREVKGYIEKGLNLTQTAMQNLQETVSTLVIDEDRMETSVVENYSLTTDLADRLAQKTGVPYRKMYKIIGNAVDRAIRNQTPLTELKPEDIVREAKNLDVDLSSDQLELDLLQNPKEALSNRTHTGGPNPDEMERQIERIQNTEEQQTSWIREQRETIRNARDETRRCIEQIQNAQT